MSESAALGSRRPLSWTEVHRVDGVIVQQAVARNNSWYLAVPEGSAWTLRYASQSANTVLFRDLALEDAQREAEQHADRYDTRI